MHEFAFVELHAVLIPSEHARNEAKAESPETETVWESGDGFMTVMLMKSACGIPLCSIPEDVSFARLFVILLSIRTTELDFEPESGKLHDTQC